MLRACLIFAFVLVSVASVFGAEYTYIKGTLTCSMYPKPPPVVVTLDLTTPPTATSTVVVTPEVTTPQTTTPTVVVTPEVTTPPTTTTTTEAAVSSKATTPTTTTTPLLVEAVVQATNTSTTAAQPTTPVTDTETSTKSSTTTTTTEPAIGTSTTNVEPSTSTTTEATKGTEAAEKDAQTSSPAPLATSTIVVAIPVVASTTPRSSRIRRNAAEVDPSKYLNLTDVTAHFWEFNSGAEDDDYKTINVNENGTIEKILTDEEVGVEFYFEVRHTCTADRLPKCLHFSVPRTYDMSSEAEAMKNPFYIPTEQSDLSTATGDKPCIKSA